MMSDYEPASGWNLPPGVFEDDIDARFGRDDEDEVPVMCGTCHHFAPNPTGAGYCRNFDDDVWPEDDCTSWEMKR